MEKSISNMPIYLDFIDKIDMIISEYSLNTSKAECIKLDIAGVFYHHLNIEQELRKWTASQ